MLAGLLWLGNIRFAAKTEDSVSVEASPAVTNAAALLQVSEPALMAALTKRNIVARGETIVTDLKMEAAVDARDALAKATYAGGSMQWFLACPGCGVHRFLTSTFVALYCTPSSMSYSMRMQLSLP